MNAMGLDVTTIDSTAKFKLGTVIDDIGTDGPQKSYKYVQYDAATAAVAGVAGEAAYYVKAATDLTGTVVTSDLSDSDEIGAGILQADLTDGAYGWVQIKGPATMSIALTAGADGDPLTPTGATDGTLDVSAAATDNVCAIAIDASASIVMCCFPQ